MTKPKVKQPALAVEVVKVADIKAHPRNYRKHPADQLEHIVASIKANGLYRNIITAADGTVLAGHGVLEAVQLLGIEEVPIVRLPYEAESPEALRVLVGDNEIARRAEDDDLILTTLLEELQDIEGLLGTGYDEIMLANLLYVTRPEEELEDFDAAAHWAGLPEYDPHPDFVKVIVNCETDKERDDFLAAIGAESDHTRKMKKVLSISWPLRKRQVLKDKRWETEDAE